MFKTFQGVTEDAKSVVYLRPETAQGIFVNFKNVQRTSRKKIPFGIGQIGSARKRSWHSLQSIRGSEKPPRWPLATQVWGFMRMAQSTPTL